MDDRTLTLLLFSVAGLSAAVAITQSGMYRMIWLMVAITQALSAVVWWR